MILVSPEHFKKCNTGKQQPPETGKIPPPPPHSYVYKTVRKQRNNISHSKTNLHNNWLKIKKQMQED
jgi:hypothetical protein